MRKCASSGAFLREAGIHSDDGVRAGQSSDKHGRGRFVQVSEGYRLDKPQMQRTTID
jgi:hypothetical protein